MRVGLAAAGRTSYIREMQFFSRMSPVRAYRDLRFFLNQRQPYELWFLVLAVVITSTLIWAFAHDSYFEKEYKPNIIYVQQYRLDRTDAQIIAQQKIDQPAIDAARAKQAAREEKLRQSFKKMDDAMNRLGL
ncbi:hypothetical protein SAMN05216382_2466 [Sphingomonas palmae]|uniref:Uncharacterized protein n=1 Tax=Sphingomonas palmae TaxID=1855283 RepID=A0A1H7S974_9SPHN|nr:hypothetical protein [Sphingomonas palmae]SEL68294.1 hypothetical protein SAMN05216382_2466 [Sphingomonas palmae]